MQKIIKQVDKNIVQVTIADERWYIKTLEDGTEKFVPSVTWIAEHYPKGIGFYKWLANTGWDEAEAIKNAAGDKGSRVHQACSDLLDGGTVKIDSVYTDTKTGEKSELTLEEYEAIKSFVDWAKKENPIPIAKNLVVFNDEYNYAGTLDFVCLLNNEPYIIDFKTGQGIWPSYELQVSAYKHACPTTLPKQDESLSVLMNSVKLAILQLGYKKNKNAYKFTEIEDKFNLFLAARQIWENECSQIKPFKKDYPTSLSLLDGENATSAKEV